MNNNNNEKLPNNTILLLFSLIFFSVWQTYLSFTPEQGQLVEMSG